MSRASIESTAGMTRNDPALIPLGVQDGKRGRNAALA